MKTIYSMCLLRQRALRFRIQNVDRVNCSCMNTFVMRTKRQAKMVVSDLSREERPQLLINVLTKTPVQARTTRERRPAKMVLPMMNRAKLEWLKMHLLMIDHCL